MRAGHRGADQLRWSTSVMSIRGQTRDRRQRLFRVERNLEQGALGVSHSLSTSPRRSRRW